MCASIFLTKFDFGCAPTSLSTTLPSLINNIAGIIGNNEKLIKKIIDISKITHEKMWELPLLEDHHDQIKSKNADIKNIGGRPAGAITAAAFLSNFVGKNTLGTYGYCRNSLESGRKSVKII